MIDLGKQLQDLMNDDDVYKLKEYFQFNSTATIYDWMTNKYLPNFENIIKLADYFKVNLDFLLGRTLNCEEIVSKKIPPFDTHFRKIIKQYKSSQYKLLNNHIVSRGHLNSWLNTKNKKNLPSVENLVKIADYLKISVDELVGRV